MSQVDNMIREFSTIYVTLAGKILKHAIATKDKNLEIIHDQFKVSPLYNRLLKYKGRVLVPSRLRQSIRGDFRRF